MGQQSLIYSFVARGTMILAEYTEFTGNFTSIAAQCLQKLPASNNKFTYNCDGHTFNYLVENGFSVLFGFVVFISEFWVIFCLVADQTQSDSLDFHALYLCKYVRDLCWFI
ncbi:Longin domain - like 4 [Theobroma cacao]|nr:Longin domain - like 4 [Theobroma cacao]